MLTPETANLEAFLDLNGSRTMNGDTVFWDFDKFYVRKFGLRYSIIMFGGELHPNCTREDVMTLCTLIGIRYQTSSLDHPTREEAVNAAKRILENQDLGQDRLTVARYIWNLYLKSAKP